MRRIKNTILFGAVFTLCLCLCLSLSSMPVFAAGSACTGVKNGFASNEYGRGSKSVYIPSSKSWVTYGDVLELQYSWTSDDAAGTVTNLGGIAGISGTIIGFLAVPSTTAAPSDNYTATIVDVNSCPVVALTGLKAARSGSANRGVPLSADGNGYAVVRNATLGLTISGAGNAKSGVLYIYVKP